MTTESGKDRINRKQREKAKKLKRSAQMVRSNAGGNFSLHQTAAELQNAAHLEEAGQLGEAVTQRRSQRQPAQDNPHFDPDAKDIPF